jgi:acyl carrier protein
VSMDRDIVLDKVRSHLAEELGVDAASITDETHFRDDLEADSLDLYELVMELEDTYGVKMSEQEAEGIVTVGQAVDFVAERAEARS